MARTRGLDNAKDAMRATFDYSEGGELLGKDGKPLPTTPGRPALGLYPHGAPKRDGEAAAAPVPVPDAQPAEPAPPHEAHPAEQPPEPAPATEFIYVTNEKTWRPNLDGADLLRLLQILLGAEMSAELTEQQWRALHPNLRMHFQQQRRFSR